MRGSAILPAVLLAMMLVPMDAVAQEAVALPASSFAQLVESGALGSGKDITITFRYEESSGYVTMDAEVVRLSRSAIVIHVDELPDGRTNLTVRRENRGDGWQLEIPEQRVQGIIRAGEGMSRWVGGLIGGSVGFGAFAVVTVACVTANETGNGCNIPISPGALSLLSIGGATAAGALLSGKSAPATVYLSEALPAQVSSRLQWSLAPVVRKDQKGALFTIRW